MENQPKIRKQPKFFIYLSSLFHGRVNRRNYLIFVAILLLLVTCVGFLIYLSLIPTYSMLANIDKPNQSPVEFNKTFITIFGYVIQYILIPLMFMVFVFDISMQVRRLHDINLSGWFCLVRFIPFIGDIFELFLICWPGTKGENGFGSEPQPRVSFKHDLLKL